MCSKGFENTKTSMFADRIFLKSSVASMERSRQMMLKEAETLRSNSKVENRIGVRMIGKTYTVGYITAGTRTQFSMEWKIKEFCKIEQEKDVKWISPRFDLLDVTWHLILVSGGSSLHHSEEYIGLGLGKLQPPAPRRISCSLGIIANDGSIYKFENFTEVFQSSYVGTPKFLKIGDLPDEGIFEPDGTATFFCSINDPECKGMDAEAQKSYHDDISEENTETNDVGVIFGEDDIDILRQSISDMLTKEQNCDVVLKVGEYEFKAHKGILATRSQVFAAMFGHDMMESKSNIVNIEDCDPGVFPDFLQYVYTAKVENLTTDKMLLLYCIADKYDVKELEKKCMKFLLQNPSVERFGDTLALALKYDKKELIQASEDFFAENASDILLTVNWQLFMKENITTANELFIKYTRRNK